MEQFEKSARAYALLLARATVVRFGLIGSCLVGLHLFPNNVKLDVAVLIKAAKIMTATLTNIAGLYHDILRDQPKRRSCKIASNGSIKLELQIERT